MLVLKAHLPYTPFLPAQSVSTRRTSAILSPRFSQNCTGAHSRDQKLSHRRHQLRTPIVVMAAAAEKNKKGVLFVCLGNICRSPSAEAVFKSVVEKAGRSQEFNIDSCGTGGGIRNWYKGAASYHEGGQADERMMEVAAKRNIDITSISRPLKPQDFNTFDIILGMDFQNMADIQVAADYWREQGESVPANYRDKLGLMCKFGTSKRFKDVLEVPDPYWSDDETGFNQVLDMLEDSCQGLLDQIDSGKIAA